MTNKKMTKRDYFNTLLGIAEVKANPELVKFIDHELELANEGIKSVILETLAENEKMMTISEMQKVNAELGELSNQRISALVRQLLADGKVERVEEKRKAYFKAV